MASAALSPNFHFYTDFFNKIDSVLSAYISTTSSNVISALAGTATTLLTIYVLLWGWMMLRGTINEPVRDGLQRIIKISLIWGFAMSVGVYQSQISNWVFSAPNDAAALVSGGPSATPGTEMTFLDNAEDQIYMAFENESTNAKTNSTLGVPDIGDELVAVAIILVGSVMVLYGAFLYMLSLVALAVLLGIGPLFILGLLFESTKPFFEKWTGMLFHYVFVVMLTAAVLGIILNVVDQYITHVNALAGSGGDFTATAFPIVVVALIGALILMQVQTKASALSGGVALATMGMFAAVANAGKRGLMGTAMGRRNLTRFRRESQMLSRFRQRNPGLTMRSARAIASKINPNTIKKV